MSETTLPALELIDYIVDNLLTDYSKAVIWNEDQVPFTDKNAKILMVKQEGRRNPDYVRNHDCQVWVFTKANANMVNAKQAMVDATSALAYVMTNFLIEDGVYVGEVIEDVSGPYQTNDNRFYYRFTTKMQS